MKIINVSVDIESQRLNSQPISLKRNEHNKNISEQQKETQTPQKKARKTKGTQPEKLRPDTDRISNET